jgi:hypothetical protein
MVDNSERVLGQLAPFPALLYCFSMIDMLAALYSGSTKGNLGEKSENSRRYMRDCMKYKDHFTYLLQEVFRHKLVHLSEPAYTSCYNGKNIAWTHDERAEAKHLQIKYEKKEIRFYGKKIKHDGVFIIKISKLKEDIVQSVEREHDGFLARIRRNKAVRGNFKKAVNEIIYES